MISPDRPSRSASAFRHQGRQRRTFARTLEHLESRCLLAATDIVTPAFGGFGGSGPGSGTSSGNANTVVLGSTSVPKSALTPAQVSAVYGFGSLGLGGGAGTTIAIVDAFNDPTIANDLAVFSSTFGIKGTGALTVINQSGAVINPAVNGKGVPPVDPTGGWELETALDVEWAHAMAPNANILLVEANSDSIQDLLSAVGAANAYSNPAAPVVAVSMSWGGSELTSSQMASYNTKYFSTPGITYFAAAGDSGPEAEWPASSANVVAVGGTTLNTGNSGTTRTSETAWADSGGGVSAVTTEPAYQSTYASSTYVSSTASGLGNTVLSSTSGKRGVPDVSYLADPATGVAVYDSSPISVQVRSGRSIINQIQVYDWVQLGGTSVGAPQWAAIAADANALRLSSTPKAAPFGSANTPQFLQALYAIGANATTYAADFTDITSGRSVLTSWRGQIIAQNSAGAGYDLVTGLGSPNVGNLVSDLVKAASGTGGSVTFGVQAAAASPVVKAAVAPHDILFTPITIVITLPVTPAPAPTPPSPPSTPSAPTQAPTSNGSSSPSSAVLNVSVAFISLINLNASVVLLNAQNQLGLGASSSTAQVHTVASNGAEAGAAASSLVATTASPVLPPQSLSRAPALDRVSPPRFYQEEPPFVPLEINSPALGWDFVSREAPVEALDLIAIAVHAAALGRGADPGQPGDAAPLAPAAAPVPAEQPVPENTPTLDPVLAGAVITLSGAFALHTARSNGRSRRWPTFWPGR